MKRIIQGIRDYFNAAIWVFKNDKIGCASIVFVSGFGLILFAIFLIIKTFFELLP